METALRQVAGNPNGEVAIFEAAPISLAAGRIRADPTLSLLVADLVARAVRSSACQAGRGSARWRALRP